MIYVALLRGINVGGKNKVDMKQLKMTFERLGLRNVVTYINTGNIIFEQQGWTQDELVERIEQAIAQDFGLAIKVVLRSLEQYKKMMQHIPKQLSNDDRMKCDVMFLWEEVDDESSLSLLNVKPDIDTVSYVHGAILWSVAREHVTKSGMSKIIGTKLYKQMTVRNINTTRKIYELMKKAAGTG